MIAAGAWAGKQFGYEFLDSDLLQRALTHKSRSTINNERLEFLGDAVLGLIIAAELHSALPDADEGHLSRLRSRLVRSETLADVAAEIGVGDLLRLGGGEMRSGGHQRRSLMADALEALYGAVYLDGGFSAAKAVILTHFADRLTELPGEEQLKDPKTRLQETLQARGLELPDYTVTAQTGPPHNRRFAVECRVAALSIETAGEGSSRRRAEQAAAAVVLARLDGDGADAS